MTDPIRLTDEHVMRWTYDDGYTKAEAVCLAEPGADCCLASVSCMCETWGEIQRRDDGTIWHRIDESNGIEPEWHQVEPVDYCNICLFINETGCAEEMTPDGERHEFILAEVRFEPVWENDGCSWRPLPARRVEAAERALVERLDRLAAEWSRRADVADERARRMAGDRRDVLQKFAAEERDRARDLLAALAPSSTESREGCPEVLADQDGNCTACGRPIVGGAGGASVHLPEGGVVVSAGELVYDQCRHCGSHDHDTSAHPEGEIVTPEAFAKSAEEFAFFDESPFTDDRTDER